MLKEQQEQASQTSSTEATSSTTQVQATSFEDQFEAAAEEAGLDTDTLSDLKDEIQTAVSDAIANYDESTSSTSLDETITSAVEGVLEENGLDAEDIETRLQNVMESMQDNMSAAGGPPPGGAPMGPPPPSSSDSDDSDTSVLATNSTTDSTTESTTDTTSSTATTSTTQSLISRLLDSSESDADFLANLSGILFGVDVQA
jgi:hypothetical protein